MATSNEENLKAHGIQKIVWDGPHVETDEGRVIRGSVGLTHDGDFKAAEVTLYQEYGPKGRASFSAETYEWGEKTYPLKEQAIFGARSKVADSKNRDSREWEAEDLRAAKTTDVATKYGKTNGDTQEIQFRRAR